MFPEKDGYGGIRLTLLNRLLFELPDQLVKSCPEAKILYMAIYSILWIIGNTTVVLNRSLTQTGSPTVYPLIYFAINIAACFIIAPVIAEAMRGKRDHTDKNDVADDSQHRPTTRVLQFIVFLIVMPLACSSFIGLFESTYLSLDARILQGQGLARHVDDASGLFNSAFASTEEIWRWSIIIVLLMLFYRVLQTKWLEVRGRYVFFGIAILLSSLFFGYGHVEEYPGAKWEAFVLLSAIGTLFAFYAILIRRLLSVMIAHFMFNYSIYVSFSNPRFYWILVVIGMVSLVAATSLLFRPVRKSLGLFV